MSRPVIAALCMRARAVILLLTTTCAALDLRRVRENTAVGVAMSSERFELFNSPLSPGSTFLPLTATGARRIV